SLGREGPLDRGLYRLDRLRAGERGALIEDEERDSVDALRGHAGGGLAGGAQLLGVAGERARLVLVDAVRGGELGEHVDVADVAALEEVRVEQGLLERALGAARERVADQGVRADGRDRAGDLGEVERDAALARRGLDAPEHA